jgi:hypothetical protein
VPLPDERRLRHSERVDSQHGDRIPRNAVRGAVIGSLGAAGGLFWLIAASRGDFVGASVAGGAGAVWAVFLWVKLRAYNRRVVDGPAGNDPS